MEERRSEDTRIIALFCWRRNGKCIGEGCRKSELVCQRIGKKNRIENICSLGILYLYIKRVYVRWFLDYTMGKRVQLQKDHVRKSLHYGLVNKLRKRNWRAFAKLCFFVTFVVVELLYNEKEK